MTRRGTWSALLLAGVELISTPASTAEVAAAPAAVSIVWSKPGAPFAVEVTGMPATMLAEWQRMPPTPEAWAKIFNVRVQSPLDAGATPPMAGAWRVLDGRLCFEPRFPFVRGVRYRAEFQLPLSSSPTSAPAPVISQFELPAEPAQPGAVVEQIFPSASVLPENILKFYVQFSAPMSRGSIYEHIHVRDASGRVADLPFLDIDEELWNPAMTRVTLLIDPGRIKRGVTPLEELGAVFEVGKDYVLTIDAAWRDASGRLLQKEFQKRFHVGPADRTPPDPARWTIHSPAAGTRDPLTVTFDEPMDRALAARMIGVSGNDGLGVAGDVTLTDEEKQWTFTPSQAWHAGNHALVVTTMIEDLAGNNIGKVFDVDLFDRVDQAVSTDSVRKTFTIH